MLADELDYVVGVDTHRGRARAGGAWQRRRGPWWPGRRFERTGAATGRRCVSRSATRPGRRAWAIEGTGSYGAGLARYLAEQRRDGARGQPHTASRATAARQGRRTRRGPHGAGGTRQRDARAAASGPAARGAAAAAGRSSQRRRRPPRSARTAARRDRHRTRPAPRGAARAAGRQAARALQPPAPLELGRRRRARDAGSCCAASPAASRPRPPRPPSSSARLLGHVRALAPTTARRARCRPDRRRATARRLVTPRPAALGSLPSRASPASRPIPASSGQTRRHRLSRGGDRQLNRALHTVVLHRRQHDPATRDYIARRIAEGKSRREATRLLKRYLARHLYRLTAEPGAADGLTGHRSFIPERWPSRELSLLWLGSREPSIRAPPMREL